MEAQQFLGRCSLAKMSPDRITVLSIVWRQGETLYFCVCADHNHLERRRLNISDYYGYQIWGSRLNSSTLPNVSNPFKIGPKMTDMKNIALFFKMQYLAFVDFSSVARQLEN